MAAARDMPSALRVLLVWLLVLVALPMGSGPLEGSLRSEACASRCPCEDGEAEDGDGDGDGQGEHDDEAPCDEDCDEDCEGCCDARTAAMVGLARLASRPGCVESTSTLPALDAPGCGVVSGVFRPPRALT